MKKISKFGLIVLFSSILLLVFAGCGIKEDQLAGTTWEYKYSNGAESNCKETWYFNTDKSFKFVNDAGSGETDTPGCEGQWSFVDNVLTISTEGKWNGTYEVALTKDTLTLTKISGYKNRTLIRK